MQRTRKLLLLALVFIVLISCIVLNACAKDHIDTDTDSSSDSASDTGATDTSTNSSTDKDSNDDIVQEGETNYTITVKTKGNMPLEGIKVYVLDSNGNFSLDRMGTTDNKGTISFVIPTDEYTISLEGVPSGYKVEKEYPMDEEGADIVLESELRTGDPSSAKYQLGDIIHDYSITVDGVTYKFSDILKEKDAIVLNFWFTTCSYCIEEFPDMDASYAKYSDRVALFALNGKLGGDSPADVKSFKNKFYFSYADYSAIANALKASSDETVVTLGNALASKSFDLAKINTAIDGMLSAVKGASDASAAAKSLSSTIESAIGELEDSKMRVALANFATALKDATGTSLEAAFETAKSEIAGAYSLSLPMAKDENDIEGKFGITGNPVTIVIDRYGMISFMHTGAVPNEKYFDMLFEYYIVSDEAYVQRTFSGITELTPTDKPTEEMPSQEALAGVLNNGTINVTYEPEIESGDAEYSWPFVITKKGEFNCIKPSNYDKDTSFATLHAKVALKAGEAFMFDYFSSTEQGYDILYVLVDGKDIYTISGESDDWSGCCPWVATKDGTYDIAFVYNKNYADKKGDDAVYLKNFRVVNSASVNVETYIPRDAVSDLTDDLSDYENYVTAVLGDDGYYHVGTKTGPLLLASLINYTNFSDKISLTLSISDSKELMVDGVNCYDDLIQYCNYASNSQIYSYCPVTPTLQKYLAAFVKKETGIGEDNPNQWLTLCYYYDAYGTNGKQLENPIKGLATFSAYDVKEDAPNVVEYNRVIMPRGLLYKFVPTKTGVYRFTTKSEYEVNGWVFVGDHDTWVKNGDRIEYTNSDLGERFCTELLVDPDGDGKNFERDFTNASMVAYMEAGKEYFINFAYYDQYQYGKFTFDVKFLGDAFNYFIVASPGPFTYEEGVGGVQGDTIAGGINVELGEDGYYYHKREDGTLGSRLYADFHQYTNIFTTRSIENLINAGAFNFAITEVDQEAIAYLSAYGEDGLKTLWGDTFEENWEYYQMDDIMEGKYHGYIVDGKLKAYGYEYVIVDEETLETEAVLQTPPKGAVQASDYTEAIKKYLPLMLDEETNPERQGCVAVDEELAKILQFLMDKFTFEGVEHSWTKLCYYYEYLGSEVTE